MTGENLKLLAVMFFLMIITGVTFFFSSHYGYHRYHFYVEYKEKIITKYDNISVFREKNTSGFVYLKRADFIKGLPHIMNSIHQLILENCGNCTIETNNFQLKSFSKLD